MDDAATAATAPTLWDDARGLYFVPVRHHSPACAGHLQLALTALAPRQILIESPCDFQPLAALLADAQTRPPVAAVALAREGAGESAGSVVSYYPFCSHSPEYVAIRYGYREGATVTFIDLPATHRMMRAPEDEDPARDRVVTLTDERPFDVSSYVRALCARTGCRDQHELWDHLFESQLDGQDWRGFFGAVSTYCAHVRATFDTAQLEADGTLARERQMHAFVTAALADGDGPIVVITGGFHTPALVAPERSSAAKIVRTGTPGATRARHAAPAYLVRFGFAQLDRLAGYGAGMPSPGYYHALWEAHRSGLKGPQLWRHVALEALLAFAAPGDGGPNQAPGSTAGDRSRAPATGQPALPDATEDESASNRQGEPRPGVASLLPALEASIRLADLRGHVGPAREDLLDACRSVFVKGEMGAGAPVLERLHAHLTGTEIGDIPVSAGSPPLVEAARSAARRHGFSVEDGERRRRQLDIYRKPRHLAASRFLHGMAFLDCGFGTLQSGPDFLSQVRLEVLFETWQYAWSPRVEARLIELAAGADSVTAACMVQLRRQLAALREAGQGHNAATAVHLLLQACQAGLAERAGEVTPLITAEVVADPHFDSVVAALNQLYLLWRARTVLGLAGSPAARLLVATAYRRALYLLPDLVRVRDERLDATLGALALLREVLGASTDEVERDGAAQGEHAAATGPVLDADAFDAAIAALGAARPRPAIAGAVGALRFLAGHVDAASLCTGLRGYLEGAFVDVESCVAYLRGVVAMSRELLWRIPALLETVDAALARLEEERFIALLPHLRLAFAALDPRDTDRLALAVSTLHGDTVAASVSYDLSEAEMTDNLSLAQQLTRRLTDDGLADFVATAPST